MGKNADMNDVVLKVEHLTKHYPIKKGVFSKSDACVHALEDASFEVHRGETFAIVGESGCGKSTTGKCILRLIEPTSGEVILDGEDFTKLKGEDLTRARQKMKLIFQDPYSSLNPRMTVADIIAEPIDIAGTYKTRAERDARVEEIMQAVGLDLAFKYRYPHEFSGGQRQRIGIARAIVLEPEIVVCDEPVSALDVSVQAKVINLLEELQDKLGLSYIFISHDLSVVKHISDRVAIMYLGRVMEISPAHIIYENPLHPYTKALLSAIPPENPFERHPEMKLEGEIPSPVGEQVGCPLAGRCPNATERCRHERPALMEVEDNHRVACFLYHDKVAE